MTDTSRFAHLTNTGYLITAYHTTLDIQAVRDAQGTERLFWNVREVKLDANHFHASQQVINFCMLGKRDQKARIAWFNAQADALNA